MVEQQKHEPPSTSFLVFHHVSSHRWKTHELTPQAATRARNLDVSWPSRRESPGCQKQRIGKSHTRRNRRSLDPDKICPMAHVEDVNYKGLTVAIHGDS